MPSISCMELIRCPRTPRRRELRPTREHQRLCQVMVGETVAEQDNQQDLMTTQSYSRLAALIFAVVSGLRLIRAVSGWPITVGATTSIPFGSPAQTQAAATCKNS